MNPSSSFFYSRLLAIFSLFCFKCKEGKPEVNMKKNGTMVTVYQDCRRCGAKSFEWKSQPLILGKYPAGNILLSFAILMAGASVTKVLLVCRHLGLSVHVPFSSTKAGSSSPSFLNTERLTEQY